MIRRLVLPVAVLAGAILLGLLASGSFAVGHELGTSSAPSGIRARIAARIAGAHARSPLAEALALLQQRGGSLAVQVRRRQEAAALLAALAARGNAQASNLLGVLDVQQARTDGTQGAPSVEAARAAFVAAIRDDPQGEDAKYNLELLLAQTAEHARRKAAEHALNPRKGRSRRRPPGSGF